MLASSLSTVDPVPAMNRPATETKTGPLVRTLVTNERAGRGAVLFVAWSLGLCVVCASAYILVFPVLLSGATPLLMEWLLERMPRWAYNLLTRGLFTLGMTAFLAAMTVALVAGPRMLRARMTRRGVGLTVVGLILAAVYLVAPMIWYGRSRSRVEEMQTSSRAWKAELRQRLESGQVPEDQRERMWQIYARAVYQDEGITTRIPDANGSLVTYEPAAPDIAARQSYLETLERLQPPTEHVRGAAIWVALCLAAGLLWPGPRLPAAPDPVGGDHKTGTAPSAGE